MATLRRFEGINHFLGEAKDFSFITRRNERTNSLIHEVNNMVMEFATPYDKYILVEGRNNSITAQIVEMMMVLSGNPDLSVLQRFLPRAKEFSDDGKIWRGNYGTRIRGVDADCNTRYRNHHEISMIKGDQLWQVFNKLNNDHSSRQAFITIGDSKIDLPLNTLDTPCTMTLVFNINKIGGSDYLDMTTFMRSNDIVFGFSGVNYFIFTSLQELLASALNVKVGRYIHHAVSFHVYDNYRKNLDKWEYDRSEIPTNTCPLFTGINLNQFDNIARWFFEVLDLIHDMQISREYIEIRGQIMMTLEEMSKNGNKLLAMLLFLPIYRAYLGSEGLPPESYEDLKDDILTILDETLENDDQSNSREFELVKKIVLRDKFIVKPTTYDWTEF